MPKSPLILGHRGYSSRHLENSLEAFRAALQAGMDGFELDVQPTRDGVCVIHHDLELGRTAMGAGPIRLLKYSDLPPLLNGEPVPRLAEALDLGAALVNVELKGEEGWKQALAAVEAADALDRVIFSSFEHSEVLQLWAACPEARCGFLWNEEEAQELSQEEVEDLPPELMLHLPFACVANDPSTWGPLASRLVLWGLRTPSEAQSLSFSPAILIVDAL